MPANTSRLALTYQLSTDPPDGAGLGQTLATQLDALVPGYYSGTASNRATVLPSPVAGQMYFSTDIKKLSIYNGSAWQNIGCAVGQVGDYTAATAPPGTLLCNGAAISRTTYADLNALAAAASYAAPWGPGDGSTTFNVPTIQGVFVIASGGGFVLGVTGGSANAMLNHTHTGPSHTHTGPSHSHGGSTANTDIDHAHGGDGGQAFWVDPGSGPNTAANADSNDATDQFGQFAIDGLTGGMNANNPHAHTISADGTGATGASGTGASGAPSISTTSTSLPPYIVLTKVIYV